MQDYGKEILTFPLLLLKLCGQNPEQNKMTFFAVVGLYSFFASTVLCLIALQLLYMEKNNLIVIVKSCETFVVYGQGMFKCLTVAFQIESFRKLISDTKKFWKTSILQYDSRLKMENIFKRTLDLEKVFLRVMFVSGLIAMASYYFTKDLPSGLWVMKNQNGLFIYVLIVEEILLPFVVLQAMAYETFFLSICTHLTVQFKMLNSSIKNLNESSAKMNEEAYLNKLIEYIQHHKFLLRFSNDLKNTYSPVMLVEYSSVALVTFVELYSTFQSKELFSLLRYIGGLTCALLQLSFYCVPLNYITDEATSVAQGIYECGWNLKHSSAVKTLIPFVIQRSQKEIIFTAGGLIIMNCRTVLNVLRISYSFCTVMRALEKH